MFGILGVVPLDGAAQRTMTRASASDSASGLIKALKRVGAGHPTAPPFAHPSRRKHAHGRDGFKTSEALACRPTEAHSHQKAANMRPKSNIAIGAEASHPLQRLQQKPNRD